jgi:dTDP-4-amino-4,6-dideoxygalactose transaminase
MIPFNKPYITTLEKKYVAEVLSSGRVSCNGSFTEKCEKFFEKKYKFQKAFLTTSCTDALELAAIVLNIQPGDEVIIPSYTYVSTANAFVLRGAKIVFADSSKENPNIDTDTIEALITKKTKAIVPVHYAGIACNMNKIMSLAKKHNLYVVEDAAQAINSFYKNKPLGSIGHLGTFSFHETKNITSGEGGMLVINAGKYNNRAEIIRNKGTNRSDFLKGTTDKYQWVDMGSSFSPNEYTASFLYAQIEKLEEIQQKRKQKWNNYYNGLSVLEKQGKALLPYIPDYATNNWHIFYLLCKNVAERKNLISYLYKNNVQAVFHYQSLHNSLYYKDKHDGRNLSNADRYAGCLLRLPLYCELSKVMQDKIIKLILQFYK